MHTLIPTDLEKTPRELGYRMPAEWEKHSATWIAWPHNRDDWPGKFQAIPWVYCDIVRHLSRKELVHILVNDAESEKRVINLLRRVGTDLNQIRFHQWRTDRVWLRDSGPIFLTRHDGPLAITNWKFNAWAKYDNWHHDDLIPSHVAASEELPLWSPTIGEHRLVLEGGSIDVNGAGLLLTTEECLLSDVQQRNPEINREQLEQGISGLSWR